MIGFDIQEVERIKEPEKLLEKIALPDEIAYIKKFKQDFKMHVASLWSSKEAVFKSLDLSEGEISYKDIEIFHKESGKPEVKLFGKAKIHFQNLKLKKIEISISHQKNIVGAVVVVE